MDTKKFYEGLRPEDRERVKLTVDELKSRGFDVYVAGSSLEHADYNDVDLVAKPQEGMTEGDARAGLDAVVDGLKVRGASESGDYTKLLTQLVPDSHRYVQSNVAFRNELSFGNDLGSLLEDGPRYVQSKITDRRELSFGEDFGLPQDTPTYVQSKVAERKSLNLGETKIDISVSYEPFGLNPETKHLQL
jgi:hypothetical protein